MSQFICDKTFGNLLRYERSQWGSGLFLLLLLGMLPRVAAAISFFRARRGSLILTDTRLLSKWARGVVNEIAIEERDRSADHAEILFTVTDFEVEECLSNLFEYEFGMLRSIAARIGVHVVDPYLDLDVMQTNFSMPSWYRYGRGYWKRALREAGRGMVPASVLSRRQKIVFDEFVIAGFRTHLAELKRYIMGGCLRESGLLDEMGVRQVLTEVEGGDVAACTEAWRVLTSELWLRSIQQ